MDGVIHGLGYFLSTIVERLAIVLSNGTDGWQRRRELRGRNRRAQNQARCATGPAFAEALARVGVH
jgi:hypothetical protein